LAARKSPTKRQESLPTSWPALDDTFDLREADQIDLGEAIFSRLQPGRVLVEDYARRFLVHPEVILKARARIFYTETSFTTRWENVRNQALLDSFYQHPLLSLELESLGDIEARECWSRLIIDETSRWMMKCYKRFPVRTDVIGFILTESFLPLCKDRIVRKSVYDYIHRIHDEINTDKVEEFSWMLRFTLVEPVAEVSVHRVMRFCQDLMQESFSSYDPDYKRDAPSYVKFSKDIGE
jgi:hypothetical protein